MTFTPEQITALKAPLDPKNVKPPAPGKYGEYIEGWKVIEEANRIFGHDGWSRETIENVEVCRYETEVGKPPNQRLGWAVGYRAKVRVTIYGTDREIVREGSAAGNGVSVQLYDAIESAAKEAETDAMKRAMMTLGYPFGLALYDKSKANVSAPPVEMFTDAMRDEIAMMAQGAGVGLGKLIDKFNEQNGAAAKSLKDLPATEFEPMKKGLQAIMEKRAAKQKEAA